MKELQNQIDELRADLIITYDRLVKKGMTWLIVAGAGLILAFILLITVFRPKSGTKAEQRVEHLQQLIEAQEREIKALQQGQALRDSMIANIEERLNENRQTQTKIIHQYEKIPTTIRDLNREQLREQVTNY